MTRRFFAILLTLGLGLLPSQPIEACATDPQGQSPENLNEHAHGDHSHADTGIGNSTTSNEGDASESRCCRGDAFSAVLPAVRRSEGVSKPLPVHVVLEKRELSWPKTRPVRDPRTLVPDEPRSPYVRTRAPLLI